MTLLLPINLVLYVLSAVLLWRSLARTTSASWLLLIVPLAAIVTHAIVLWDYLNADHFDHLNITTSLSTVALLLAAFTLMRSRRAGGLLLSPIIYLYAIQLLYLNYLLKHHRTHAFTGYLPPLMTVERYFFRLLSTGTALLLIAIISGFVFLNDMFAQGQSHKTILSLIAFTLYVIVLYMHGVKRARGRALVITSVIASIILSLAYFGSRFVKDILLSL